MYLYFNRNILGLINETLISLSVKHLLNDTAVQRPEKHMEVAGQHINENVF